MGPPSFSLSFCDLSRVIPILIRKRGERKELIKWFFATLAGGTVWLRNQSEWVFKEEKEEAPPSLVLNRGEVLATPPPKTQSSRKHLLFRRRRERREGNKRLCYLFFLFFLPHIWEAERKGGKTDTLTPVLVFFLAWAEENAQNVCKKNYPSDEARAESLSAFSTSPPFLQYFAFTYRRYHHHFFSFPPHFVTTAIFPHHHFLPYLIQYTGEYGSRALA